MNEKFGLMAEVGCCTTAFKERFLAVFMHFRFGVVLAGKPISKAKILNTSIFLGLNLYGRFLTSGQV